MSKPIELNIHVNSSLDRRTIDTTTHDWVTFLAKPIKLSGSQKMKLAVDNIEMPNSAYTFPPTESVIWYLENFTDNPASYDGGVTWNIVKSFSLAIDQVYDAATLVTALNAGMTANSDPIVFSYSAVKGKLIAVNNSTTKDYFLAQSYRYGLTAGYSQVLGVRGPGPVIAAANNIIDRLGFCQEDLRLYKTSAGPVTYPITADGLVRLNRTNCYFLTCESISSKIKQSQSPSPYVQANIIGKMPSGQFGTISVIRNPTESFDYEVQDRAIESFKFGILDDQLESIGLNHCTVTFTLRITII